MKDNDKVQDILDSLEAEDIKETNALALLERQIINLSQKQDMKDYKTALKLQNQEQSYEQSPEEEHITSITSNEIDEDYNKVLDDMPPRYKETLLLYINEGLHLSECAKRMGIPYPTIYNYLNGLRARVAKKCLNDDDFKSSMDRLYNNLKKGNSID